MSVRRNGTCPCLMAQFIQAPPVARCRLAVVALSPLLATASRQRAKNGPATDAMSLTPFFSRLVTSLPSMSRFPFTVFAEP